MRKNDEAGESTVDQGHENAQEHTDGETNSLPPYAEARKLAIATFEKEYLEALLQENGGNVSQAARNAGIDRVYLHRLIRRHKLRE